MGTAAQTGIAEMGDILQGQGSHSGRALSHAEIAETDIEEAKARKKEVQCLTGEKTPFPGNRQYGIPLVEIKTHWFDNGGLIQKIFPMG